MFNFSVLKNNSGVSLIELMIVLSIVGILALVGIPQYERFVATGKVRSAATDLLQNMRLARTMAIRENRAYLITFNEGGANTYRIGFDGNGDGDLSDAGVDAYGEDENNNVLPVREVDLQDEYGSNVVAGSGNFTTTPPNGPNGVEIADAPFFRFNPDGTATPNGIAYFQHDAADRGYAYCVELANAAGLINIFMWEGNSDDPANTGWNENAEVR